MPNKFINGKKKFKKNKVRELDSMMSHIISTFDYLYENSSKSLAKSSVKNILREFQSFVTLQGYDFKLPANLRKGKDKLTSDPVANIREECGPCGIDPSNPDLYNYFPGDINNDSSVDVIDFALFLQLILYNQLNSDPSQTVSSWTDFVILGTYEEPERYCFLDIDEDGLYDALVDVLAPVNSQGICIDESGEWFAAGYIWAESVDWNPIN